MSNYDDRYFEPNEGEKKKKKRIIPIIIIIVLVVIIGGLVAFLVISNNNNSGVQGEYIGDNAQGMDLEDNDVSGNKIIKSVSMPGWDTIHLDAGTTAQEVDFYNPSSNADRFMLSFELKLANGETLYKSGLVKAGDHVRNITLSRSLQPGTYYAVVHIQPYTDDENRIAKNNADVSVTLIVT